MNKPIKLYIFLLLVLILGGCEDEMTKKKQPEETGVLVGSGELKPGMYKDEQGNIYYSDGKLFQAAAGADNNNGVITGGISDTDGVNYTETGSGTQNGTTGTNGVIYGEDGIPVNAIECNDSIPECREFGFGDGDFINPNEAGGKSTISSTDGWNVSANQLNQFTIKSDGKTLYFDLDQSTIKENYIGMLRKHSEALIQNPDLRLLIEGHADERGSREYNIALSESRAKAVERFLEAEGVLQSQMTTVAYGEERPLDMGHNQAAWARNRRAVLVYQ